MMKPYKGKLTDNILREDAIKALCKSKCHPGVLCPDEYCLEVREVFDGIPSQPERKRGRWIRQRDKAMPLYGWLFCSECGAFIGREAKFCSECGAEMEVSE